MKNIIFGSGCAGRNLATKMLDKGDRIDCFVDNARNKWGTSLVGIPIKSPEILKNWHEQEIHVLVAVAEAIYYEEISAELEALGMVEGKHFSNAIGIYNPVNQLSGFLELPEGFELIKGIDEAFRLIINNEEKRIFRAVFPEFCEHYRLVYDICVQHNLFGNYIVDTKVVENCWNLPSSDLLLEHAYIEPISYSIEWSPEIFEDYVIFMINFIKELDLAGLALIDGHSLNVTFHNGKFILLDFGSIRLGKTGRTAMMRFVNMHINTLLLMKKNKISKAYLFLKNINTPCTLSDIKAYLDSNELSVYEELIVKFLEPNVNMELNIFCDRLLDYCKSINCSVQTSRWEGYQNNYWDNDGKYTEKQNHVIEFVKRAKPQTMIDLAGNMGWYPIALSEHVKYAIAADFDYNSIDYTYREIKKSNGSISNVIPIYLNIIAPTLDYHAFDHPIISKTGIIPWRKNAIERFRCELAMATAVVHHLVFSQSLTFQEIISQLKLFTERYLIVEFVDSTDKAATNIFVDKGFEWYTKEAFCKALEKEFVILDCKPSTPNESRILFLCEVK